MSAKIFINVQHFELSAETRQKIHAAAAPLFEQDCCVTRVDITIEGEYARNTRILYNVTVRTQLRAEVFFEMKQGERLLPAVKTAISAMEKKLRERGQVPSA